MDPSQTFIEKMGLLFEADGMPRTAGRMLALLLLSAEALSLDELAEALQVSKASASTNARLLERMGALERVGRPGDRRDYYGVNECMPERMLAIRLERVARIRELVAEGLEAIEPGEPAVRERLEELERFHGSVVEKLERSLEAMGVQRDEGRRGERSRAKAG